MAKSQYPINGRFKKDYKITSPYGYRMHPIRHEMVHHNGVDFWGAKEPLLVEAWHDGIVTVVATNMASFGNYVVIRSKVGRTWITSLYAHLKAPSKLREGQRVDAGTVVGIMGATGPVTGKHLHFEIGKGRTHPFIFGGDGSRYFDPIKFMDATIKKEEAEREKKEAEREAALATPIPEANTVIPEVPKHSLTEEDVVKPTKPKQTKPAVHKKPEAHRKPAARRRRKND